MRKTVAYYRINLAWACRYHPAATYIVSYVRSQQRSGDTINVVPRRGPLEGASVIGLLFSNTKLSGAAAAIIATYYVLHQGHTYELSARASTYLHGREQGYLLSYRHITTATYLWGRVLTLLHTRYSAAIIMMHTSHLHRYILTYILT